MTRDLAGKTYVVTGCNTGIGRVTAETLAARGAEVLLLNRSEEKTAPVLAAIEAAGGRARFVGIDLDDLASARATGESLRSLPRIDGFIANAGLAGFGGLTKQGFEKMFGVNHLGHFVLTEWVLPVIAATPDARIVFVASKAHYQAKAIDWAALRRTTAHTTGLPEYAVSKLCNVLYAKSLAARLEGKVTTYSLHPGVVASDVWRDIPAPVRGLMKLFMITNEEGAKTTLHCATDAGAGRETGLYYDRCKPVKPSKLALDASLAEALDARSREFAAGFLPD